ncbi:MAG: tryptophan 7-halogenase [Alphaproteobacteria bacterium]|nr:tryptophan 7-halogenase [Alphaproteobacteria bacterium]
MSSVVDVIIVGAGPAGTAAAIWARLQGLSVMLFERAPFPRFRPGETLHPGVELILDQLGVRAQVVARTCVRPTGQYVSWAEKSTFEPYGEDENGPWRGFQISRAVLDAELLSRARALGACVIQPCRSIEPLQQYGRVVGVIHNGRTIRSRFVVDASGQAAWLQRKIGLSVCRASSPLRVFYGYRESSKPLMDFTPQIIGQRGGWEWTARISERTYHWCRLSFDPKKRSKEPPQSLLNSEPSGPVRGADVTWRNVNACVGHGYFIIGDAAMVLDPAGSHGVLRALMSGIMAMHVSSNIKYSGLDEQIGQSEYQQWLRGWFETDVKELGKAYEALKPIDQFYAQSTAS